MYYRVAIQVEASPPWQWKSTALNSQSILLQWLQFYRAFPRERLRIFSSPSREELNEQLARENQGFLSTSVPATRFLQELLIAPREGGQAAGGSRANERTSLVAAVAGLSPGEGSTSELSKRRERLERGVGGEHDLPYRFTLPISTPHVLAWLKLQVRVQQGDLQTEVVAYGSGNDDKQGAYRLAPRTLEHPDCVRARPAARGDCRLHTPLERVLWHGPEMIHCKMSIAMFGDDSR